MTVPICIANIYGLYKTTQLSVGGSKVNNWCIFIEMGNCVKQCLSIYHQLCIDWLYLLII